MKRALYICAFAFLGLVLATIIHGVVELIALEIIFGNPDKYADTNWWREWDFIHQAASNFLWLVGFIVGTYFGYRYWEPYGSKPGFYHWKKQKPTSQRPGFEPK